MKNQRLKVKWGEFGSITSREFSFIFKDPGVLLILVFAIFIYSILYSFAYKNEVLRDVPIAVIDNSATPMSRKLISSLDAAENMRVEYVLPSMADAKALFYEKKINGIVYIPYDYERRLLKGENVVLGLHVDASNFLMYRQVFQDAATVMLSAGAEVQYVRLLAAGTASAQAKTVVQPVEFTSHNLYNPYLGYGSFLMPAIIIVIIQQTLLIGIGMIGGTWREYGTYKTLIRPGEKRLSTVPIVLGKTTAYITIYTLTITLILGVVYPLFGFPLNGSPLKIALFLVPYVLACIFLGITISTLFRNRENSLLFMLWTSIPILLLSGASIPREGLPEWMYAMGKVFPSSMGVEGFIRMRLMGAGLAEVSSEFVGLWILAGAYFATACLSMRALLSRKDL